MVRDGYEREHGSFVGAMAISYGLAVTPVAVLLTGLLFLPLAPFRLRYARGLCIHLDRRMDPEDPKDRTIGR